VQRLQQQLQAQVDKVQRSAELQKRQLPGARLLRDKLVEAEAAVAGPSTAYAGAQASAAVAAPLGFAPLGAGGLANRCPNCGRRKLEAGCAHGCCRKSCCNAHGTKVSGHPLRSLAHENQ
jgi:hypothetical protein